MDRRTFLGTSFVAATALNTASALEKENPLSNYCYYIRQVLDMTSFSLSDSRVPRMELEFALMEGVREIEPVNDYLVRPELPPGAIWSTTSRNRFRVGYPALGEIRELLETQGLQKAVLYVVTQVNEDLSKPKAVAAMIDFPKPWLCIPTLASEEQTRRLYQYVRDNFPEWTFKPMTAYYQVLDYGGSELAVDHLMVVM